MAYPVRTSRPLRGAPWALLALAAGCGSVATDGVGSGNASLAVAPEYPAGLAPGSLNLVIDQVRLRVVRPPSEWLVDTTAAFPANATSLTMRVQMPLKAHQEQLGVVLELHAGPLLVFSGSRMLEVTEGTPTGPPPTIPMTYRGPGAEARVIRITPRDTVMRPGGTLTFGVTTDNGSGVPAGDVYVSWTAAGTSGASVTPGGVLTAAGSRGSVLLRAVAATGARDSTRIWFAPAPTTFVPVSGGGQAGVVATGLPAPLVARVTAADGLGVPGIPVQFFSTAVGSTVNSPVSITDADGYARTTVRLGTRAGAQAFAGFVPSLGGVQFTMFGQVGPAAGVHIVRGNDQETVPGGSVAIPLEVVVRDEFGNPVRDALVRWSVIQGGGQLGLTEAITDGAGVALSTYRMGPALETNFVRATLEVTGTSVVFLLKAK